jgi:hypothetical protein
MNSDCRGVAKTQRALCGFAMDAGNLRRDQRLPTRVICPDRPGLESTHAGGKRRHGFTHACLALLTAAYFRTKVSLILIVYSVILPLFTFTS